VSSHKAQATTPLSDSTLWRSPQNDGQSSDALDGATATVPNALWRKVICAESLEAESPETKQPA